MKKFIEINDQGDQRVYLNPAAIVAVEESVSDWTVVRVGGTAYGIYESAESFLDRADIEIVPAPRGEK